MVNLGIVNLFAGAPVSPRFMSVMIHFHFCAPEQPRQKIKINKNQIFFFIVILGSLQFWTTEIKHF